jgi:hypothetical protein
MMERTEREEIQERYKSVIFPDPILEPLWTGKRPTEKLNGRYAIMDQKENTFYNFCTDQYQIVHHEEVIKMVEEAVKALPEFGNAVITPRIMAAGGKMAVTAKFLGVDYEIRKGDIVNPTINVKTSYDLGWKLSQMFGAYRLVCSNGMTIGEVFSRFKKRHVISLNPQELSESIKEGMSLFSDQVGLWKNWANQLVSEEAYDMAWKNLPFSTAEKEKIENLHEQQTRLLLPDALKRNELNLWDFNNVLTQFVTHEMTSELRKVELGPQIARVMETIH